MKELFEKYIIAIQDINRLGNLEQKLKTPYNNLLKKLKFF